MPGNTMHLLSLILVCLVAGCAAGDPANTAGEADVMDANDRETLLSSRVLFGHQSVGQDVLAGMAEVVPGLGIVKVSEWEGGDGPVLVDAMIGANGDPKSKDRAFLELVDRLKPGDVALYKYCYIDMAADTDPDALCAAYERTLDEADARGVRTVAVTMPVTTVAPVAKRWLKRLLGRTTDTELNQLRQRFNERLRGSVSQRPLIDLAGMEAAPADADALQILRADFTHDGAHLNPHGQRTVATQFGAALAAAIRQSRPETATRPGT
ncbi:hypothetical protein DRQ53_14480 [bacterium]|nr:MAG: hypothetical protein DRQ53_14480 [bacterium]